MKLLFLPILLVLTTTGFAQTPRGRVQIKDGTLVTDTGTLLRGVYLCANWNEKKEDMWVNKATKAEISRIKELGLNCVHIYHEDAGLQIPAGYWAPLLDSVVKWTREESLYLIIVPSWWGGLESNFVYDFWKFYAPRYKNETHVIYEIANEPFQTNAPYDYGTLDMERRAYDTIHSLAPETHVQLMCYQYNINADSAVVDIKKLGKEIDWKNASISAHGYQYSAEDTRNFIKTIQDSGYAITITENPVIRYDDPSPDLYANRAFIRVFEQEFVSYINFMSVRDLIYKPYLFKYLIESTEIRWTPDFGTWPENLTAINYTSPYKPILAAFCDESSVGVNYDQKFAIWVQTEKLQPNGHIAFYNLDFGTGADSILVDFFAVMSSKSKLEVHLDSLNGPLIGLCPLATTKWDPVNGWYSDNKYSCPVKKINGIHKIYLVFKGDYGFSGIFKSIVFTKPGINAHQPPYYGIAFQLPGKIEAEEYDNGSINTSYFDKTSGNTANKFRYNDVDIETTTDTDQGYNVGWIENGEWLEYTICCSKASLMDIQFRIACTAPGEKIRIKLEGQILGTVTLPNTSGWQNWKTVTLEGVPIPAGENQILRLEFLGSGFNLNWLNFVAKQSATYYVSQSGSDSNTSEQAKSVDTPWQTISRVNYADLQPGDSVLFKRGDIFRGNLIPKSGSSAGYITYGAYSTGEKPKILGSIQKNEISDWELLTNNIWQTTSNEIIISEDELLYNPNFVTNLSSWTIWAGNSSDAIATMLRTTEPGKYISDKAAVKIYCEKNGETSFNIQFYTAAYSIKSNTWYRFSFYAKASKKFQVPANNIWLMENNSPYTTYSANSRNINIDTLWNEYEILFESTSQSTTTRIDFALGSYIPDGTYLYIDSCSFKELENDPALMKNEIGNIILNDEAFCGVKMKNENDMHNQGDFWYDSENMKLKIYSPTNPALYYSNIELAVNKHIINQQNKSYIIFEDLDLRYGAAHGISGGNNTHHTLIRDVDFSFIGGGYLAGYGDGQVRFGNGVEFYNAASYNIVERCTFNEIYDAALTVQGNDNVTGYESHHIYFRNNIIKNSEYSYELWGGGKKSYVHHVFFEHNTCRNAGYGWGHAQRPDPIGTHIMNCNFQAKTDSILIRNNIFSESSDYGMCFWTNSDGLKKVKVDYNSWFESSGDIARIENTFYDFKTDWKSFQKISGFNEHAFIEEPLLKPDFSLNEGSPCINAGILSPYVSEDFRGLPRPSGSAPDIGAFEFQQPTRINNIYQNEKIKIYPNPAKDYLKITTNENATVEIITIQGLLLKKKHVSPTENTISVDELTSGSYVVKIVSGANVFSEILIVE